jgi:hypothetical protein
LHEPSVFSRITSRRITKFQTQRVLNDADLPLGRVESDGMLFALAGVCIMWVVVVIMVAVVVMVIVVAVVVMVAVAVAIAVVIALAIVCCPNVDLCGRNSWTLWSAV